MRKDVSLGAASTAPDAARQLYCQLQPLLSACPQLDSVWTVSRFLRSAGGDSKTAHSRLLEALSFFAAGWREQTAALDPGMLEAAARQIGWVPLGVSPDGRLVLHVTLSASHVREWKNRAGEHFLRLLLFQQYERLLTVMLPICSRAHGRRVDRVAILFDAADVSLLEFVTGRLRKFVEFWKELGTRVFPEIADTVYVSRASFLINLGLAAGDLLSGVRQKVHFWWSSEKERECLQCLVPQAYLPVVLSGSSTPLSAVVSDIWYVEYLESIRAGRFHPIDPELALSFLNPERPPRPPSLRTTPFVPAVKTSPNLVVEADSPSTPPPQQEFARRQPTLVETPRDRISIRVPRFVRPDPSIPAESVPPSGSRPWFDFSQSNDTPMTNSYEELHRIVATIGSAVPSPARVNPPLTQCRFDF